MNEIILVKAPVKLKIFKELAIETFGDLVKAVVDVKLEIMAIGGKMHADEEKFLLEQESEQDDLWGINIYPDFPKETWIEFDSMINIRPRQNNRSRGVEGIELQNKIIKIVNALVSA